MMTFTHVRRDMFNKITCSIEYVVHDDDDIHEVMQEFRRFLLAVSFQPGSIAEYIEAD